MFKDTGYNMAQSRKHEFLDVPTMRKLYDFCEKGEAKDGNGKETFFCKEKMVEYNSYLLSDKKPDDPKSALLKMLRNMSAEGRAALMKEASR